MNVKIRASVDRVIPINNKRSAGAGIVACRGQAIQRRRERPLRHPAGDDRHQPVAACVLGSGGGGDRYPDRYRFRQRLPGLGDQ